MQPERIEKVKFLLASVLARPPLERDAYLAGASVGDDELRREVERYLNSGEKTEQFNYNAATTRQTEVLSDAATEQFSGGIPTDPRVGKIFGKYIIQKRLAEGGMGIVYVALDTQLGREVALKVLPEFFSRDQQRLQRFQREARAISLLNHPNIVTIFEIGQIDGCEFIVTEFVEGETLREKMAHGQIPFVEMLKIASQVAGALSAAHKAGIIHRDIKPENVMLRPDGYVKVLDFGLAKLTDATKGPISGGAPVSQRSFNHTMPGTIMGTAAYMSPEQAEGGEVDVRTDIWGLGILLYEMVSGRLPFHGPTASHTIVAILEQTPEPVENATPDLQKIISTALQKNKDLRYQTAEAMAAALGELKQKLGYVSDQNISGPVRTERTAAPPQPRRNPYRKLLWLIPSAFILLLAGTLVIYAAFAWLLVPAQVDGTVRPAANSVLPAATKTPAEESNVGVAVPSPSPSPNFVYVDPTPGRSPEPTPTPARTEPQRRQPEPVIQRPVKQPEPKKEPRPKPKPKQDPNCVFTNSCKS